MTLAQTHARPSALDLEKRAFRRALTIFREAAERVPAYKHFLRRAKIKPETVRTWEDFKQVPFIDKANYISKYSLEEMCWDGSLSASKFISSSSGSTGIPLYWPRGRKQDIMVGSMFRRIYENVFDTRKGRTLCIDSFALGAWIAGLEFYNATKWTADLGSSIALVTPGIDKAIAVDEIKRLAPSFDRVILAGYPPFVKDILEHGAIEGIDWKKLDVRLFTGGEAISERWRDRVLGIIGRRNGCTGVINMYGMAETGIVGFETPFSIALRRSIKDIPELDLLLTHMNEASALYQYDPMARYFQTESDDALVLTADAGIPLVRYDTRDTGGLISHRDAVRYSRKIKNGKRQKLEPMKWSFPFVYLHGRRDLSVSLYALNIYVENVKYALESSKFALHLSGLFTMNVEETENLDQQFCIAIELSRGTEPSAGLSDALTSEVVDNLCKLNSEYAKLFGVIGERAKPKLTLLKYGEIQTVPGRKHKWIKRS